MTAVAKVWTTGGDGRTWMVHVKNDFQWARVTGLRSEQEAIWEADALVSQFDTAALSRLDRPPAVLGAQPKEGPVTSQK